MTLDQTIAQADKVLDSNPFHVRIRALSDYQARMALLYISSAYSDAEVAALTDRAIVFAQEVKD